MAPLSIELITRRSRVRIPPPLYKGPWKSGGFLAYVGGLVGSRQGLRGRSYGPGAVAVENGWPQCARTTSRAEGSEWRPRLGPQAGRPARPEARRPRAPPRW